MTKIPSVLILCEKDYLYDKRPQLRLLYSRKKNKNILSISIYVTSFDLIEQWNTFKVCNKTIFDYLCCYKIIYLYA